MLKLNKEALQICMANQTTQPTSKDPNFSNRKS